jgi:hypothetical protein
MQIFFSVIIGMQLPRVPRGLPHVAARKYEFRRYWWRQSTLCRLTREEIHTDKRASGYGGGNYRAVRLMMRVHASRPSG